MHPKIPIVGVFVLSLVVVLVCICTSCRRGYLTGSVCNGRMPPDDPPPGKVHPTIEELLDVRVHVEHFAFDMCHLIGEGVFTTTDDDEYLVTIRGEVHQTIGQIRSRNGEVTGTFRKGRGVTGNWTISLINEEKHKPGDISKKFKLFAQILTIVRDKIRDQCGARCRPYAASRRLTDPSPVSSIGIFDPPRRRKRSNDDHIRDGHETPPTRDRESADSHCRGPGTYREGCRKCR